VWAVQNPDTGYADFLALNGRGGEGQVQLIRSFPNPSPNPLSITSGPSGSVSGSTATFTFTSSVGTGFLCAFDLGDPQPCVSGVSYAGLGAGRHRFSVWAVDGLGNALATAVSDFTIA
jgi:hypothetical protein